MSEKDPDIVPEELPQEEEAVEEPEAAPSPNLIETATGFVREHPGLTIASGIAIGLIAGALIPKGRGRRLAKHAVHLAELASVSGLAFGRHALERAESAGSDLRQRGSAAADRLGGYGEAAAGQAGRFIDTAEEVASNAGRSLARKATELKSKMRR
ncbi:MAG: hypothetical protein R3E09_16750 [Novosphingobium sp.]|nr:hypothetical protein [Novosphingobium sp.]